MYYYGPPHMAKQKQDDQLEHTNSSYVRIRDVALKTCQRRWTIGRSGEIGSGISILAARHDDDDDDDDDYEFISKTAIWCNVRIYSTLTLWAGCDTRSIFKQNIFGLNFEFFFYKQVTNERLKSSIYPSIYSWLEEKEMSSCLS